MDTWRFSTSTAWSPTFGIACFKARQLRALARESTIGVVVDDDPEVFRVLAEAGFPVRLADWVPMR